MSKIQTNWDLNPLFKSDNDKQMAVQRKAVAKANTSFIKKWKGREDYLTNPAVLVKALDEFETLNRLYGSDGGEGYYFSLRSAQDQNNSRIKAGENKIRDFANKLENNILFFTHNIAKIPKNQQSQFLKFKGLSKYCHFLDRLFAEAQYLLSEPEEKILNLKSAQAYGNWVKMVSGFLAKEERIIINEKGKKEKKSFTEILSLLSSKNKKTRDSANIAFNDILLKHSDSAEAELNSILLDKKTNDELREIKRPDLSRHISDDIDSEVIDSLIEAVSKRFNIAKRYYQLKAKLFGVKKLKYHERNVEYGKIDVKYNYQESVDLVYNVLSNLDKKFANIFQNFSEGGNIDVFPKKGKMNGAFCAHYLITQPTYILLNHTDKLNDVLTLAHEVGHGINNELIKEKQNSLSFGTPTSTAEVASTFVEDFVLEELKKGANEEARLVINMQKLNDDVSTIFRQIACYKFEQDLHKNFREKGYLSKEEIGKIFQKNMSVYMGPFVEQSTDSENWWVYWSHIRSFFYVYSYASGLLISKSLQAEVKKDPAFIEKVQEFLSAGLSDSPKNIFQKMGINISDKKFWSKGLKEIESLLKETEKLAKKLRKIK